MYIHCFCFGCSQKSPQASTPREAEIAAYKAGWRIGHLDAQGHYVCPDCYNYVWEPLPLTPTWKGTLKKKALNIFEVTREDGESVGMIEKTDKKTWRSTAFGLEVYLFHDSLKSSLFSILSRHLADWEQPLHRHD